MNILIIWAWAFWTAMAQHISYHNPHNTIYGYDSNKEIILHIQKTWKHPYFFSNTKLNANITFLDNLSKINKLFDVIILAVPSKYIWVALKNAMMIFSEKVSILNLSKWINEDTQELTSHIVKSLLKDRLLSYSILSWWMLAEELLKGYQLWADLWSDNFVDAQKIQSILESNNLEINIVENYQLIEFFGAIKNVILMYMGYLEGIWLSASSIWLFFCKIMNEVPFLLEKLNIDRWNNFRYFSLDGDLMASYIGNSRNKEFWKLVWSGIKLSEALQIMEWNKKYIEWIWTLQSLKGIIMSEKNIVEFKKILTLFIIS